MEPRTFFRQLLHHAIQASHPATCLPPFLHALPVPQGKTVVVGAGKASAAMAQALEQHWPFPHHPISGGLVVTRYGQALPCQRIEMIEAAHPLQDHASEQAARRITQQVQGLSAQDQVIALISGGGSALMSWPAPGLTLADKQAVCRALLGCGANIGEINIVRKHLSATKGGRLALAAAPAQVITLCISDIPGDDPTLIASGPTLPDASSLADAQAVLDKYRIALPANVAQYWQSPEAETPKPGDPGFTGHQHHVIASSAHMLAAAASWARSQGVTTHILSDSIEGEAASIGHMHAAIARHIARTNQPFPRPCLLLSGGETTVTLKGQGRGGRNSEFLLAMALALNGAPGIHAMAADTDGIDGSESHAGATLHPDSLARASAQSLLPANLLANNDSHAFFHALGDLLITGPTHTNVNDLRAVLIT